MRDEKRGVEFARFMKEINEKNEKYFKVYDTYTPNYKNPVVTGKFYSKYEYLDLESCDPEVLKQCRLANDKGPKDKLQWPETTNQEYGWFTEPLVKIDKNDERFYFGSKTSDFIRHELKLKMDPSSVKRKGAKKT